MKNQIEKEQELIDFREECRKKFFEILNKFKKLNETNKQQLIRELNQAYPNIAIEIYIILKKLETI